VRPTYFIGWDVGAWHCKDKSRSQDAFCILTSGVDLNEVNLLDVRRGYLSPLVRKSLSVDSFIENLFDYFKIRAPEEPATFVLAIDAPLGVPDGFRDLIELGLSRIEGLDEAKVNPYLYRKTEMRLAREQKTPLSLVQDQIGSQTTKALHLLRNLGLTCGGGIWSSNHDGCRHDLFALETYPAAVRKRQPHLTSAISVSADSNPEWLTLLDSHSTGKGETDRRDAIVCGVIAAMWNSDQLGDTNFLEPPNPEDFSEQEGWIWVPTRQ
jgi:hypothetical protein